MGGKRTLPLLATLIPTWIKADRVVRPFRKPQISRVKIADLDQALPVEDVDHPAADLRGILLRERSQCAIDVHGCQAGHVGNMGLGCGKRNDEANLLPVALRSAGDLARSEERRVGKECRAT